jgi:hypothetical protein
VTTRPTIHPAAARRLDEIWDRLRATGAIGDLTTRGDVLSALLLFGTTVPQAAGAVPYFVRAEARGELGDQHNERRT